jgi:guanylate kinase
MLKRLFADHPGRFGFSVSRKYLIARSREDDIGMKSTCANNSEHADTTRSPRAGENHGEDYNFVTRDEFQKLIDSNGFIEHAQFGSNLYGTSFAAVEAVEKSGTTCILDIEMEGVKQVHKSHLKARFLFLSPPGMEELEKRLRGRGTDKEEDILKRLKQADVEMEFAKSEGVHDKVVVNDDLERAYKEVEQFCLGED